MRWEIAFCRSFVLFFFVFHVSHISHLTPSLIPSFLPSFPIHQSNEPSQASDAPPQLPRWDTIPRSTAAVFTGTTPSPAASQSTTTAALLARLSSSNACTCSCSSNFSRHPISPAAPSPTTTCAASTTATSLRILQYLTAVLPYNPARTSKCCI